MAGKAIKYETIKKNTITDMQKLGIYKPEYDPIIDIYCAMREQYGFYLKQLKDSGYRYAETTAAGGTKKLALVGVVETLRKDILQYSDRLQLNPKALADKAVAPKKQSALQKALERFE